MTELQSAEEDVHRLQERMMHVSRLATMGEMAAGIAHEINQPLTAVHNYARACERLLEVANPDLQEVRCAVHEIAAEALRAGEIIRRMRQLVGKHDSRRVAANLNDLIEQIRVLMLADARAHDARMHFELASELPQTSVDGIQIQHVLLNLVRNALEALSDSPAGARHVTICTAQMPNGEVEVSVRDNGPGAAPKIRERMFEPFRTTKEAGTGLGLTISRTIAQAHGGAINYRPASPSGACFALTLPAIEDDRP